MSCLLMNINGDDFRMTGMEAEKLLKEYVKQKKLFNKKKAKAKAKSEKVTAPLVNSISVENNWHIKIRRTW